MSVGSVSSLDLLWHKHSKTPKVEAEAELSWWVNYSFKLEVSKFFSWTTFLGGVTVTALSGGDNRQVAVGVAAVVASVAFNYFSYHEHKRVSKKISQLNLIAIEERRKLNNIQDFINRLNWSQDEASFNCDFLRRGKRVLGHFDRFHQLNEKRVCFQEKVLYAVRALQVWVRHLKREIQREKEHFLFAIETLKQQYPSGKKAVILSYLEKQIAPSFTDLLKKNKERAMQLQVAILTSKLKYEGYLHQQIKTFVEDVKHGKIIPETALQEYAEVPVALTYQGLEKELSFSYDPESLPGVIFDEFTAFVQNNLGMKKD